MFQNVQPLSADSHRELRYRRLPDYSFAAELTSVPVTFSEMVEAAKYYPLVFPKEGPPAALLGVAGKNEFIDEQGQWKVPYVPLHVSRYPFILGETSTEGQMVVMIDFDAPHFKTDQGERIFDEEGTPGPVVDRVKTFLGRYQEEAIRSKQLTARLFEAELLQERTLQRRQGEETRTLLRQFFVVDEEKFLALPDETLPGWHRDGTLRLVYAHLFSLTNLNRLKA